jgi:K+-sensing histidine kinase KdpD
MGFASLCILFMVGIFVASLITGMLRGVILFIGSLSLAYYFFVATPEKQKELDAYALQFNFAQLDSVKEYVSAIKTKIASE